MQVGKQMKGFTYGKEGPEVQYHEPSQTINYFQTQQNCNKILNKMLKKSKYKALSQGIEYFKQKYVPNIHPVQ